MESLEKPITDAFGTVYDKAMDGPAGEFLRDGDRADGNLDRAIAMTEYVILNRRGLNPYREDMADKMAAKEFFSDVSDNELDATRHVLGALKAMRSATKVKIAHATPSSARMAFREGTPPAIANKVETSAVVKLEEKVEAEETARKLKP